MRYRSLLWSLTLLPALAHAELYISILQGLGGQPQYDEEFTTMREQVLAASKTLTGEDKVFTFAGEDATREKLLAHFNALNQRMTDGDRAAIYLIGHGSFDGEVYKFNIPGPDLSAADFKDILEKLPGQNHVVVNSTSTSGAMVESILGTDENAPSPDYILVAATRNGNERNSTHFGRFFAEALTTEDADINKNNNISIQEAFDYADRSVTAFFEDEGRLATEHPQLRGEGAAAFSLSRVNEVQIETDDPELSELLQRRIELDAEIEELQLRRSEFASSAEYLTELQALIVQSAELTEQIELAREAEGGDRETPPRNEAENPVDGSRARNNDEAINGLVDQTPKDGPVPDPQGTVIRDVLEQGADGGQN